MLLQLPAPVVILYLELRILQRVQDLLLVHRSVVIASEPRVHANRAHVQDHANAPNVDFLVVVFLAHFGRHEHQSAHTLMQPPVLLDPGRQAHVDKLQVCPVGLLHAHIVLQLNIAVHHRHAVQVRDAGEHLPGVLRNELGVQAHRPDAKIIFGNSLAADVLSQCATFAELHDQVIVLIILIGRVELHDVRVGQPASHPQLILEGLLGV
mmetsp:Transcript_102246/g.243808  ORF Transcript_102246/g.243808 Transcript_102246/m.243808 type:complete len:209 (+) Transcript_102246:341-967(+)